MNIDIRQSLHTGSMNLFQIVAVTVCVLISFIDGFDVLAIAFTGPSITAQWGLSPEQLGLLFSSGLAGMVAGALLLSPLADKFGRRFIVLTCLAILSLGMFASGLSDSYEQLITLRIITGLGMGAILPAINTVVAEYSSNQYRSLAISIMAAGYTVGAMVGGILSIYLINSYGWRYVFFFGGAFSLLLIPIVIYQLPESLDFLLNSQNKQRLTKLNQLLVRLGLPTQTSYPEVTCRTNKQSQNAFKLLFTPAMLKTTLLLCCSYFMLMCSFYFLTNWTPKILVNLGYSTQTSITGSILMNLCGIVGGLSLGWLSRRYSVQVVTAVMLIVGFVAVVLFGFSQNVLIILLSLITLIGFTLFGAMAGLYATAPKVFPAEIRTTGTGFVLGIGRLGATIGPYLAGILIAANWSMESYFTALGLPLIISALCIWLIRKIA
ncbi:MFS transporter [Zophobihabitans entericus]|uniref:MFS transporter n=1 Tax=Zophobihabitans entericus TaxID=1635327 RepID=A0A6G9IAY1_9GAMM|nr:MFS transporter [Zophobihabitans entericus]QIQ20979.1 MFS transporter [Zophobihabitans entericus]